jgi:hypothetical protein
MAAHALPLLAPRYGRPYCTLDGAGQLVEHPPEAYWSSPLETHSAVLSILHRNHDQLTIAARMADARRVTELLMLEMDSTARLHGATFAVAMLYGSEAGLRHYRDVLARYQIPMADCAEPITPAEQVPGDNHPNGAVHARWARCIAAGLGR